MSDQVMIRLSHMCKSFGIVKAVNDVSTDILRGEVRALIGENGSGKSTLSALITGAHKADSGTITYKDKPFSSKSVVYARERGIAVLLQERGTVNGLTVAENVFLGSERQCAGRFGISSKKMRAETARLLHDIGADHIRPEDIVDRMSFEDRKLVEVARAMLGDPEVLIVDETTTALSHKGRQTVYDIVKRLKATDKTVIFISHDLDEVVDVCDSATVLRDGEYIDTVRGADMTPDRLRTLMIGRSLDGRYYRSDLTANCGGEVVLAAEHISLEGKLHDVSIELHRGEVLGLGGLTESGMHELCRVIFGALRPDSGCVRLTQRDMKIDNCVRAINAGIAYLPKDRNSESLFGGANVIDNISVVSLDKVRTGPYISPRGEKALAAVQIDELSIKCSSPNQRVGELSGGNKQKVVVGKWLAKGSDILIMDCPTRGIDVGVKSAIYSLMQQLTADGKSIIMVSEELPELIGMSDRIVLMKDGKISGTFLRSDNVTESKLVSLMI